MSAACVDIRQGPSIMHCESVQDVSSGKGTQSSVGNDVCLKIRQGSGHALLNKKCYIGCPEERLWFPVNGK